MIGRKLRWLPVAFALAGAMSCGKAELPAQAPASATPPPAASQTVAFTEADWRAAIAKTFAREKETADDEGVRSYAACFPGPDGPCALRVLGKDDDFRRVSYFTPIQSAMRGSVAHQYLRLYVALQACGRPLIFLAPRYFDSSEWLFMSSVAVMSSGSVVIDRALENLTVDREVYPGGVQESAHTIASPEDVEAIRQIATNGSATVRITGSKGYVTMTTADTKSFIEDARNAIAVFDILDRAAASVEPASCKP